MNPLPTPPSQRRYPLWLRLGVMVAILILLALVQYAVLLVIVTHSFSTLGSFVFFIVGASAAFVLWRGWHGTDPPIATLAGIGTGFIFAAVNTPGRPICGSHPTPVSFPYLWYEPTPAWVTSPRILSYPELVVSQPSGGCWIGVSLAVAGGAFLLFTTWLWVGDVPADILDRLAAGFGGSDWLQRTNHE